MAYVYLVSRHAYLGRDKTRHLGIFSWTILFVSVLWFSSECSSDDDDAPWRTR